MKNSLLILVTCLMVIMPSCDKTAAPDLSSIDPGRYDSTWYNRAPLRFIQTNLREIDANMDVDAYVQALKDASANAVIFNVGGIRAFYPTELRFHYKSPYLEGDLVGEVIEKFHENGIKFIARFDMSKVHESIAEFKPDWLYVSEAGKNVNYNGEVHTCITGGYQQEYAFSILEEAITAYPIDGVFFNNSGFTTGDYSQHYHGLCQCDNCRNQFRESRGMNLPAERDMNDPVYLEYREWQQEVFAAHTKRIKDFFNALDPGLVYFNRAGEVWRSESGTGFTSSDYFTYHATEHTKRVLGSRSDQMPGDTYNYLLGMDFRHTATSPNIGRLYLAQHMLNGAGPGIYFIGRLENQHDRVFLPGINEIYGFNKTYEKLFTNIESRAKVGLVMGDSRDYRGIMRLLTEEQIMYNLITAGALGSETMPRNLDSYDVIILSNVAGLRHDAVSLIDDYVKGGGGLIVTGLPGISGDMSEGEPPDKIMLECLGVMPEYQVYPKTKSTYLKVEEQDKKDLEQEALNDFDVIMMYTEFLKCRPGPSAKGYMKLIENAMHGPPERCYIKEEDVADYPGFVANEFGQGKSVFIPWLIGSQYNWRGNNAHRALFLASLQNLLDFDNHIITDCPPLVEMTHMSNRNGAYEWIGMINHSGQLGNVFREPVPIYNSSVRFQPLKPVSSVYLVRSGKKLKFRQTDGWVECLVPELDDFEMILCLYR